VLTEIRAFAVGYSILRGSSSQVILDVELVGVLGYIGKVNESGTWCGKPRRYAVGKCG